MRNLIIEVTSRCNLSCSMCLRQTWEEGFGDMGLNTFQALAPVFPRVESVNLSGYGEPLLHAHLMDMIHYARRRMSASGKILVTTNGTLIDRAVGKELMNAGVDEISLSIDSLAPAQFQEIRQKGDLDIVTDCLETLGQLRGGDSKITISFVAMKSNLHELPKLLSFAADRGVGKVWVNNVLPPTQEIAQEILYDSSSDDVLELFSGVRTRFMELGVKPDSFLELSGKLFYSMYNGVPVQELLSSEELEAMTVYRKAAREAVTSGGELNMTKLLQDHGRNSNKYLGVFQRCRDLASARGVELHLPLITPRTQRECAFVRNEVCFVTWDGWVRPCNQLAHDISCFHYGREKRVRSLSFGNIAERELSAIWDSEAYGDFRNMVKKFPFSPCGDCGVAVGCDLISPDSEFVSDCYANEHPCGDCLWSRGILQCP